MNNLVVIGQILIWQLLFLETIITFIVSYKFDNLLLPDRKWYEPPHDKTNKMTWASAQTDQSFRCVLTG